MISTKSSPVLSFGIDRILNSGGFDHKVVSHEIADRTGLDNVEIDKNSVEILGTTTRFENNNTIKISSSKNRIIDHDSMTEKRGFEIENDNADDDSYPSSPEMTSSSKTDSIHFQHSRRRRHLDFSNCEEKSILIKDFNSTPLCPSENRRSNCSPISHNIITSYDSDRQSAFQEVRLLSSKSKDFSDVPKSHILFPSHLSLPGPLFLSQQPGANLPRVSPLTFSTDQFDSRILDNGLISAFSLHPHHRQILSRDRNTSTKCNPVIVGFRPALPIIPNVYYNGHTSQWKGPEPRESSILPSCPGRCQTKRKKPRTSFTRLQIVELEKRFHRQKYLASNERTSLAKGLKMTDAQVKTWFQNRRTKWRRQTAEERDAERQAASRLMLTIHAEPCGIGKAGPGQQPPDPLCLGNSSLHALQNMQPWSDTEPEADEDSEMQAAEAD